MKKCSLCGRWGFFLKLNEEGLCSVCVYKRNKELKAEEEMRKKELERQEKINEYNRIIEAIPVFNYELSKDKAPSLILKNFPQLKFSNVTARSNYDKLGTFVVIDTETTGISVGKDKIIEIAAIRYEDWEPTERFNTLINPQRPIPEEASKINHITYDMVEHSPSFYQIIPGLKSFVGDNPLVGHNIFFDLKIMYKSGCDLSTSKRKYFDTLELARKVLKAPKRKWNPDYEDYVTDYSSNYDIENHKLDTLCDYYKIRDNKAGHRALSDCYATAILFQKLVKERTYD